MLRLVLPRLVAYGLFGWCAMFAYLGSRGGFGKDAAMGALPAGIGCGVAVAISAGLRWWRARSRGRTP
jgi:hypothetical protein